MSTIQIPAEFVRILRCALISELGEPTDTIHQASLAAEHQRHPEWFWDALVELDQCRAALEAIGWREPDEEQPVRLDLQVHRQPIAKALRTQLTVEHEYIAENAGKTDHEAQYQYALATHNAQLIQAFLTVHELADDA